MKRIIYLILLINATAFSTPSFWSASHFSQLSNLERYQFIHEFDYWKINNPDSLHDIFIDMWQITDQKSDIRSKLAIQYYCTFSYQTPGFSMPFNKTPKSLLKEMQQLAFQHHFEVEEVVSNYYLMDLNHRQDPENYTKTHYPVVVKTFDRIRTIGFEKFKPYALDVLLYNLAEFMWNLKDFETSFHYLSIAEKYIKPNTKGALFYTLILSHIQEYWYKKQDYSKSIAYSKKILQFHHDQPYTIPPHTLWWKTTWLTLTHLNISKALIKLGQFEQGNGHAKKSLELSQLHFKESDIPTAKIAQYDALSVLISIKMELKQIDSLPNLFNQALDLQNELEEEGHFDYFKSLAVYENLYQYYSIINEPSHALQYLRKVKAIQDSTALINNHLEISRIQKKIDLEKHTQELNQATKHQLFKTATVYLLSILLIIGLYLMIKYYLKSEKSKTFKQHKISIIKKEVNVLNETVDITTKKSLEIQNKFEALISKKADLEKIEQLKKTKILTTEDWSNFKSNFEQIYPDFIPQLKDKYPPLTNAELRLLILEKLELNTNEIAEILGVNKNTIHQTRRRFRKKIAILKA